MTTTDLKWQPLQRMSQRLAELMGVRENQVQSVVDLLAEGATVPFIARYRKEATGGLDDTQLRLLEEKLNYFQELDKRKEAIFKSIAEQGKMTDSLLQAIDTTTVKSELEDLYLPYKPKRRNKAQIAREAGLEPLATALMFGAVQLSQNPKALVMKPIELAKDYLNTDAGILKEEDALEGAKQILMEQFSEAPVLIGQLRELLWKQGLVVSTVVKGKNSEGEKFSDYFDYAEPIGRIPSHRALALFRGEKEGFLKVGLYPADPQESEALAEAIEKIEARIARFFNLPPANVHEIAGWLRAVVQQAWKQKISGHLESDCMATLKESAETEAIQVFAKNLRSLLLAPPAGKKVTLGLDPGFRTGVKTVVVDETGKLLEYAVIYPHMPQNQWEQSLDTLFKFVKKHHINLVSIGNGTASRETDRLAIELMKMCKAEGIGLEKMVVSEAGASVYSASELAAKEFPNLDVSYRGAVSIARRLQDPLAELVKIEAKAIGVGQYQHDVNQTQLARSLDTVVQDCVNAVGVDVNTASVPLLTYISGLSSTLAKNIVAYREENGAFKTRTALKKVPRMGAKGYEQAAGFLRIVGGDNPLDASSVHPEAYSVVEKILKKSNRKIQAVIGDKGFLAQLNPQEFTDETFGLPTVKDILAELEKPGRDPRPAFKTATFQEGVQEMKDLKEGMVLEGVVTNVTNFGAFVDIGVHQDGLVHISQLANQFVTDPHTVVKTGDVVSVKVLEVDVARKRISLTRKF
ncbi:MAG: RNA-binding transcriptional accessory protein [Cyanobacteria bacterium]|nr:RNA-binding transcriptional accessory protein [Cyanobacteriota bacterium]